MRSSRRTLLTTRSNGETVVVFSSRTASVTSMIAPIVGRPFLKPWQKISSSLDYRQHRRLQHVQKLLRPTHRKAGRTRATRDPPLPLLMSTRRIIIQRTEKTPVFKQSSYILSKNRGLSSVTTFSISRALLKVWCLSICGKDRTAFSFLLRRRYESLRHHQSLSLLALGGWGRNFHWGSKYLIVKRKLGTSRKQAPF